MANEGRQKLRQTIKMNYAVPEHQHFTFVQSQSISISPSCKATLSHPLPKLPFEAGSACVERLLIL